MAELTEATEIALANMGGDEYFPVREDATPGLLRLSLVRLTTWLFGDAWGGAPSDGDLLTWDSGTGAFLPAPASSGGIADAPDDGDTYAREGLAWVITPKHVLVADQAAYDAVDPKDPNTIYYVPVEV